MGILCISTERNVNHRLLYVYLIFIKYESVGILGKTLTCTLSVCVSTEKVMLYIILEINAIFY